MFRPQTSLTLDARFFRPPCILFPRYGYPSERGIVLKRPLFSPRSAQYHSAFAQVSDGNVNDSFNGKITPPNRALKLSKPIAFTKQG